jgi:outer membrane protein TolC
MIAGLGTARNMPHLSTIISGSALVVVLSTACLTPAQHIAEADEAAYAIIQERRDALAAGGDFSLDRSATTLRQRLAEGETPAAFSLAELLDAAAENSRSYQDRRESLYLAALDLTLERWRFSLQTTADGEASVTEDGGGTHSAGVLSSVGFSRLLGTGAQIVGDASIELFRDIDTSDGWDALSNLSLTITQPLLRGFGNDIVLEPLTQAERNVLYEARVYERFRRTFAFDVTERFFSILRQINTLTNEEENARGLTLLRERNEAFAEAGQLNEIQVDQALQDELRARNRVIDAERSLETQLDAFKLLLGLPIGSDLPLDASDNLSLERWPSLDIDAPEQLVVELALANRFDHLTALQRVEDAERRVLVAVDALGLGLDLVLSGSSASPEGQPLDHTGGSVRPWRLALELDLPVDLIPERNFYRESMINLERAHRDAEESADRIVADMREALRSLAAVRKLYEIQERAVELAERRVLSTELNLEAGRAETRDVLESKEALLQARNSLTANLTEFILSGLALYRDMELLRVSDLGIDVETAPIEALMESRAP